MYGYVIPDKPNMFVKDFTLYRAFYCGLCKSIGKRCNQVMRFSTSYDMTFFNVLAHAVLDKEVVLHDEVCILNPIKKKSIVKDDEVGRMVADINALLLHYKLRDDANDDGSVFESAVDKTVLRRSYKRARAAYPDIDAAIASGYEALASDEKAQCGNIDAVSHHFASIMRDITALSLGEAATPPLCDLMYNLGKWVYVVDAVDDIDDDYKKKNFNMFLVEGEYSDRAAFLLQKGDVLKAVLNGCLTSIADDFDKVSVSRYEGVLTNILWYGLLKSTNDILRRTEKCKKTRI